MTFEGMALMEVPDDINWDESAIYTISYEYGARGLAHASQCAVRKFISDNEAIVYQRPLIKSQCLVVGVNTSARRLFSQIREYLIEKGVLPVDSFLLIVNQIDVDCPVWADEGIGAFIEDLRRSRKNV